MTHHRQNAIQRQIERLCEEHRAAHGSLPWYKTPPFPEPLCAVINPLCPTDLCILPYGHVGTTQGYHVLGTTNYSEATRFDTDLFVLLAEGTSRADLCEAGERYARRLFPDHYRLDT